MSVSEPANLLRGFIQESFDYELVCIEEQIKHRLSEVELSKNLLDSQGCLGENRLKLRIDLARSGRLLKVDLEQSSGEASIDKEVKEHCTAALLNGLTPFSELSPEMLCFVIAYNETGTKSARSVFFEQAKEEFLRNRVIPDVRAKLLTDLKLLRQASISGDELKIGIVVQRDGAISKMVDLDSIDAELALRTQDLLEAIEFGKLPSELSEKVHAYLLIQPQACILATPLRSMMRRAKLL